MHDTLPLLNNGKFPRIYRGKVETLQINLGYLCNQACLHCHVNAGPTRKEQMTIDTIEEIVQLIDNVKPKMVDLTGGAPELNVHFKYLVTQITKRRISIIDRCNLTILSEPGQEDLTQFLSKHKVIVTASLPCYSEENVNSQRGDGVFERSIDGLRQLNGAGYGKGNPDLQLHLVYNPIGASLPPPQKTLEKEYKQHLSENYDVSFDSLLTITNMPIKRFGSTLISRGEFGSYLQLLESSYQEKNLASVMCKTLLSIDWEGYVYDCDFNQMLGLPFGDTEKKIHVRDLKMGELDGNPIAVRDHCFGCTAGNGSSCSGAMQ
ncbi:arsenosugar biosynthesis radical SAM protein ArsS [Burkholderiales bacterium]|nr:arsenosugar biosynthesis radical SAM protein ArsS [Burkholderiales bacterium]MDC3408368.1 arsenosugar biosynthesis radical SAM protein ArsS [Burkholderiales bacterium]